MKPKKQINHFKSELNYSIETFWDMLADFTNDSISSSVTECFELTQWGDLHFEELNNFPYLIDRVIRDENDS